jgi:integrase
MEHCESINYFDYISITEDDFNTWLSSYRSASTIRAYRRYVLEFISHVYDSGVPFYQYVEDGTFLLAEELQMDATTPTTRARFFAIKSFLNFYADLKGLELPPDMNKIKPGSTLPKVDRIVSIEDAGKLLNSALEVSDICYLSVVLAYCLGLSVNAMLKLRVGDAFYNEENFYLNLPETVRARARTVEISKEVYEAITEYSRKRELPEGTWLFRTTRYSNKTISGRTLSLHLEKACQKCGVEASLQSLRTSYIAYATQYGSSRRSLAAYVGITNRYVGSISKALRQNG